MKGLCVGFVFMLRSVDLCPGANLAVILFFQWFVQDGP
jgi:hypothetical protein